MNYTELKRMYGRRSVGDRRNFSYAVVFPERRSKERRTTNRRSLKNVFSSVRSVCFLHWNFNICDFLIL